MKSPIDKQLAVAHFHTTYSVLDGASGIDEYIKWCKSNNSPGLAISDHGLLIGALELYEKSKKAGIIGLPGIEFYIAPPKDFKFNGKPKEYWHLTAWAITEIGYRNLLKLGSISFNADEIETQKARTKDKVDFIDRGFHKRVVSRFGDKKPRITLEELFNNHEGIVIGSGCLIGALSNELLNNNKEGAESNLNKMLDVFKGRMFMEVFPTSCTHNYNRNSKEFEHIECTEFSPDGNIQKSVNSAVVDLAKKYNIPLIMSTDAHFVHKDQHNLQTVLLQNGDPDGWHFYHANFVPTTETAWQMWSEMHGSDIEQQKIFSEAIEGTHELLDMGRNLKIKDEYKLPDAEVPESIIVNSTSKQDALKQMIFQKIEDHGRMKWDNPIWTDRLMYELSVICDNGVQDFSEYFLFMEKWGTWARDNSVMTGIGRGSSSGSLLAYLLKITHIDPLKYNLPFERFLSMGRISRKKFPDIDADFGPRDPVVAKMMEYYGENVAQCSTHGKIKVKSAIKDIFRISIIKQLEESQRKIKIEIDKMSPFDDKSKLEREISDIDTKISIARMEVDSITKSIPNTPTGVDDKDFLLGYKDKEDNYHTGHLEQNPQLQEFFKKYSNPDRNRDMQHQVESILGIPRSIGRHASSVLVSSSPIRESSPTIDVNGVVCTQYTANGENYVEKAGLIKFDILTVNTLHDIARCIRLIQKSKGYKVWTEKNTINNQEFSLLKGELSIELVPSPFDDSLINIYDLPERSEVFEMITRGDTSSIFQISTALMTNWAIKLKPNSINDLGALVAIVRPGPLEAKTENNETTMTMAYIKRKNGEMPVTYIHPSMEKSLKSEYGVAVYQENLQEMFSDILGYSMEEADYIRELIGKKKAQDMDKLIPELRAKLKALSWTDAQAQLFIDMCIAAAKYSFNKAHSSAYAYTAYMSAFLKCFYPTEWWTAVLQNCKVEEIREKGYARAISHILVAPHVNGPTETFDSRSDGKVHSPLWLIDGVGEAACNAIEKARGSKEFTSIQDFYERIDRRAVNEGVMKKLILVGAFDLIEQNRRPEDLYQEYIYLKTVSTLKVGAGKSGNDLKNAVATFKAKGSNIKINEAVLEMTMSEIQLQNERIRLLPIYKFDVHEKFMHKFQSIINYYDLDPEEGIQWGLVRYGERFDTINGNVVKKTKEAAIVNNQIGLEQIYAGSNGDRISAAWAGIVESTEEFKYTDKKTKKQVTALKVSVINAGDSVECILWPKFRELMKNSKTPEPAKDMIVLCVGDLKPSRLPGKWTISSDFIRDIT